MTNWNRIQEIERINARELQLNLSENASWHSRYKHSAYIYAGNLSYELNEGDLITVFSQFGEIVDCNLIRDKETGDPKGFAFIAFEDQRSTNLAVDNMNGALLLNRTLNVDHVDRYRKPKKSKRKPEKNEEVRGEVSEDDETYEERRTKIWDYKRYAAAESDAMTATEAEFDDEAYLSEKRSQERAAKEKREALEKNIEIRRMKRKLIRMSKRRKRQREGEGRDAQGDVEEWIDEGTVLRDANGRRIDIEAELKRKERKEAMEEQMKKEAEAEAKRMEKKQKKLSRQSKSQRLNKTLKKLNKKMKKQKKQEKYAGTGRDEPPSKRRRY